MTAWLKLVFSSIISVNLLIILAICQKLIVTIFIKAKLLDHNTISLVQTTSKGGQTPPLRLMTHFSRMIDLTLATQTKKLKSVVKNFKLMDIL